MLLFCEKVIRGGQNNIGEKISMRANNKYVPDVDETKPSVYGLFLEVANLHVGTMTKHRPVGHFLWVQKTLREIIEESNDSEGGYFVMVDLEYPKILQDNHNDFPMAAEKQLKTAGGSTVKLLEVTKPR